MCETGALSKIACVVPHLTQYASDLSGQNGLVLYIYLISSLDHAVYLLQKNLELSAPGNLAR
mgnify:CR=1 FL=1